MERQFTEQERAKLEQALDAAKGAAKSLYDGQEEKRWQEINFPLSLEDSLSRLTKTELSDIRSTLGVRNLSSLNKQELIAALAERIPHMLSYLLQFIDEPRYAILKRMVNSGGQAHVDLEVVQYNYFKNRGLAFTGTYQGRRVLVMPREVLDVFKGVDTPALRKAVREHTEWIQLSQGLLYYYGFLKWTDLKELINKYIGTEFDTFELLEVLSEAKDYGHDILGDIRGFWHLEVFDVDDVIREHQSRPDVPFYPFTKAQVLRAGQPDFIDRSPAYKAFVDFLTQSYGMDSAEADDIVGAYHYDLQVGDSPTDVLNVLNEQFEIPSMEVLQAFTYHITELHNNSRQWFLKGHTPNELLPTDLNAMRQIPGLKSDPKKSNVVQLSTKKKVGRNDPCPCGSGKKFKKCCGR